MRHNPGLLGAFGSTATIKYRGVVISGVAALAIVLSYVVVDQAAQTMKKVAFGTLLGDIKGATIEIIGDHTYLGAMRGKQYEFIIDRQIDQPTVKFNIIFPENKLTGEKERELPVIMISKHHINRFIGTGEKFEWTFKEKGAIIEDSQGNIIYKRELPIASYSKGSIEHVKAWVLPTSAYAQDVKRNIHDTFVDLASGSPSVRRDARSELADRGPGIVLDMMKELRKHYDIYQVRLGVLEALKEMLKIKKEWIPEIREKLSDEDRKLLVKCLTDNDLAIRVDAGMILFDLSDIRVIKYVLDSAKNVDIDKSDWLYLHVFAIKGSFYKLPESEKRSTLKVLIEEIRPKSGEETQALIDSFHI